jgi:hypothetical protein
MPSRMTRTDWGLDTVTRDEWRTRAACSPATAEWFWVITTAVGHPALTADNRAALALCETCPVRRDCHQDQIDHPQRYVRIAGGGRLVRTEGSRCSITK